MSTSEAPSTFIFVTGHLFGLRALEGIVSSSAFLEERIQCLGLYCLPEVRQGGTVGYTDPRELATSLAIPINVATDGSLLSHVSEMQQLRPRYIVVIGWSRLIHSIVLDIPATTFGDIRVRNTPSYGCLGMHPSPLPVGRGQAPLPWTIMRGLTETALSTFFLEDAADTGSIVRQQSLQIHRRETATSLFLRMANRHFSAGAELAGDMALRSVRGQPQDDALSSVWPRRRPEDGEINLERPAAELDAFVRGLRWPYPAAFLLTPLGRFLVYESSILSESPDGPPGIRNASAPDKVEVQTNDGVVVLSGIYQESISARTGT